MVSDSITDIQTYIDQDLQPQIADISDSIDKVDASLQKTIDYLYTDFDVRTVDWNNLGNQVNEAIDTAYD